MSNEDREHPPNEGRLWLALFVAAFFGLVLYAYYRDQFG